MSAGGSMVHPKVPCLLFTPICPHTLSFRPVILPDSVELRIVASEDARGSVWIAVDGRSRTQVEKGMQVLVSLSAFPFPMWIRFVAVGLCRMCGLWILRVFKSQLQTHLDALIMRIRTCSCAKGRSCDTAGVCVVVTGDITSTDAEYSELAYYVSVLARSMYVHDGFLHYFFVDMRPSVSFTVVTCSTPSSQDAWLESLKKTLNWNCRVRQGDTPAGEGEVQQRGRAGRGSTSSRSTSRSASSSRSIIRSDRRSRDSSAFDSSDGDAGSCEKDRCSRRTPTMNDSSSRRRSDGTARDGGTAGKSCEAYYRQRGDERVGRRSNGSTSITGRSNPRRTNKEAGTDSLLFVRTASRSDSGKGLDRRFAADAEEEGNWEDWEEDRTTYGSMRKRQEQVGQRQKHDRMRTEEQWQDSHTQKEQLKKPREQHEEGEEEEWNHAKVGKHGASVGLPDECHSVGPSGTSNRVESGAESRWSTCGSMRGAADISLEDERNNVPADSDRTCSHGRVGTGRHEFDNVVTDDVGGASVGSTSPSNTRVHTTDSKQGGQNLFASDFSKHPQTEGDEPVDSSLPVMSSSAPPVGSFRADAVEDVAATGGAHIYPDAATEHTVTTLRDTVHDSGETVPEDVGVDFAAVDSTSTPRARPPVASRNAVLAETCRGPQELQQEEKVAQPGVGTETLKKSSWGVDSAFRLHTRVKRFAEQETERRDNTGAVSLQAPSTTASVHHQKDSGSGRKVKAKADAAERELPPADAPSTEDPSDRYRAAVGAGRTKATGATSNRHLLSRRSSVSSNLHSTSASRNGEFALNRKRRSRVSCLRKCLQIGRRMRMRLSLRLRHRWASAGTRDARSLLLERQILAITQEHRRMRQPSAPASTTELTLSRPAAFSSLRCTAPPATGATGDSAAASRFTSALLPHRGSDALTSCCDATTYCSTSPTSMGVLRLLEQKRQETEQSTADDVTAVCRSERCPAWLAAQLAGLGQSEKTSPERVSENGVLPPSTCDSRRSGSHERVATSSLAGQPKRGPTAGNTRWEERSSIPAAGYMHQGGWNRRPAVFDGSKEEGNTLTEQSRGDPRTLEACYCDGKRDQEQQIDGTLEKGTDELVRDRGRITKQDEEGAQQEGDGQDLRQMEKNGSQAKEGRERTQNETEACHSKVAKQKEEPRQKQRLLQSADTYTFVGVERVTGGIERQRRSTAGLTMEVARRARVDNSMCYSDTAGTQEQRRRDKHDDFQQKDVSPVTTFARAEAGAHAEAASGNVADDAWVAGTTALLNGKRQTENSVACDGSRQLTGPATLECAASPACGSSRGAAGEALSSTRKSRALCEAANRTAATGASTLTFPTVAGAAPSEVANGAAMWNMSPETVRFLSAGDSCVNYGSCKRKPEWQPVHISNDVAFSSQERGACDSAAGVPPEVRAVLLQKLFKQRPYVRRELVQGSEEEVEAVDDAYNCESQAGSRTGTLSKKYSISKLNDSDCSWCSHKNDCNRQEKDSSSSGPISSSERNADRKSFVCPGARGKAPTHASEQRWQPGASGSACASGAVSALPLAVQKRPQHDHHDSLGATDTTVFHMGCRLAEAAKEISLSLLKGESNDSLGPASGESTLRSSPSASVSSHPPAPPFLPAQYYPTHPPCSGGAAPVGATSFSPWRQKSGVCTAEKAGGQGEQPRAQQSCCLTTAVALDVSFSWPEHRERALEQTGEPDPSSQIFVNVKNISQQRLPAQSSSSVKERLETIEEEDLVDCRTSVREREVQRRNLQADNTRQDNSEAAAVRRTQRSNIHHCAFSAGTLVPDWEGVAEEDEEARRRDQNMCGNLRKHSRTLLSLRPSSSAGVITHSSERTKRSLTQATSVFMQPTDRCTAVSDILAEVHLQRTHDSYVDVERCVYTGILGLVR
ncbi:UNVERIFIED_CONTAM: hypothetical protein H355_005771 [Colinus virginianus]|nr:hypothetical protein H355_005771 [Colinus virginianus]